MTTNFNFDALAAKSKALAVLVAENEDSAFWLLVSNLRDRSAYDYSGSYEPDWILSGDSELIETEINWLIDKIKECEEERPLDACFWNDVFESAVYIMTDFEY